MLVDYHHSGVVGEVMAEPLDRRWSVAESSVTLSRAEEDADLFRGMSTCNTAAQAIHGSLLVDVTVEAAALGLRSQHELHDGVAILCHIPDVR